MTVEECAEFLQKWMESETELRESFLGGKFCDLGHWSRIFYSPVTGWSQVVYFCESPLHPIGILSVTYYESVMAALVDTSIFPINALVWFEGFNQSSFGMPLPPDEN